MSQAGVFPWSRPMPHNHGSIGQGGAVPLGSITGHTKPPHDALAINADQVDGEEAAAIVTGTRVNPVITKVAIDALAINADQVDGEEAAAIVTKARCEAVGLLHSSTSGRTANDHHAQAHNLDTHAVRNHANLQNIPANQHVVLPGTIANVLSNHSKAIHDALGILHSSTGGRTVNDHHPQAHNLDSHAVRTHANLQAIGANDHHPQAHNLDTHATRNHTDLLNVSPAQHHSLPGLSELTFDIGCRAYRNADQVGLVSGAATKVLYNAENYDIGGNFNANGVASSFTVPSNGYYLILANAVIINAGSMAMPMWIYIYDNGAVHARHCVKHEAVAGTDASANIKSLAHFVAGRVLDIRVRQDCGANRTLGQGATTNYVCIAKVGV